MILVMGLLVASGCRTSGRYHLAVGNVGTNALSDVEVSFSGDAYVERIGSLPGQGEHYFRPLKKLPSREVFLSWNNPQGTPMKESVAFSKGFAPDAHYRIYLQIERDQSVNLFVDRVDQREGSIMPWGKPANWEGTVSIPGLTAGDE